MEKNIDTLIAQLIQIAKYVASRPSVSFEERASTILQYRTLSFLESQTSASLSDVAKYLTASLSSTTQLIDRMHKAGFVARNNDQQDRRIIRLSVTKEGLEKLAHMKEEKRERMKKLLGEINKKDVDELIKIQEKMIENIKEK